MNKRQLGILSIPVLVAALGYFVDIYDLLLFTINEVFDEKTSRGMSPGEFPGVIRPLLRWTINKI